MTRRYSVAQAIASARGASSATRRAATAAGDDALEFKLELARALILKALVQLAEARRMERRRVRRVA